MQASGPGVFENEAATVWVAELEEMDAFSALRDFLEPIEEAPRSTLLEAHDCQIALAAAEVIAAGAGNPARSLPDAVESWLETRTKKPSSKLVALARRCVERIASDSEIQEYWEESKHAARWKKIVEDLEDRLAE